MLVWKPLLVQLLAQPLAMMSEEAVQIGKNPNVEDLAKDGASQGGIREAHVAPFKVN
jgi:hypothetical protein